jgi:hypothetical protein
MWFGRCQGDRASDLGIELARNGLGSPDSLRRIDYVEFSSLASTKVRTR